MIAPVMPTYARYDLAFERGEGAYLITADGRRLPEIHEYSIHKGELTRP